MRGSHEGRSAEAVRQAGGVAGVSDRADERGAHALRVAGRCFLRRASGSVDGRLDATGADAYGGGGHGGDDWYRFPA